MFKSSLLIGAITIAVAIAATPSFAQDYSADPTYGSETLQSGFTPDPFQFNLTAGGATDVSDSIGGSCRGFVADAPDFDLIFEAGSDYPLAISVAAGEDTTLVINGPDGRWYCDDDSGDGVNPSVVFRNPDSGLYNIWVGTYENDMTSATLAVSELTTY